MRRTAIVLALTAVLSLYGQRTYAADFKMSNPLLPTAIAPAPDSQYNDGNNF
jgi:hypothetical protein